MLLLTLRLPSPPTPTQHSCYRPKTWVIHPSFGVFTTLDSNPAFSVLREFWMGVSKDGVRNSEN